jgi:hypothetical protein
MLESEDVGQEMAAEALEKSKLLVSFAVTPATQKPKLATLVSRILDSKDAKGWRLASMKRTKTRTRWVGRLRSSRLHL